MNELKTEAVIRCPHCGRAYQPPAPSPEPEPKKRSAWRSCLTVGAILTALLFVVVIGNAFISSTSSEGSAPRATATPRAPATATPAGLTFDEVCTVSRRNLTQPQMEAHARSFEGLTFTGWQGYVYDVVGRNGDYQLQIAMRKRGNSIIWSRDIVLDNIFDDLAVRLNVEQPITFSGHIAAVETTFGTACNPMRVDKWTITE